MLSASEHVWRTDYRVLLHRRRIRILVCLLIGISTVFGFLMFDDMNSYMPWQRRVPKALVRTFEVHLGLWLATLEVRSRWRFLVALLLIPSGVGTYLLLWNYSPLTIAVAAVGLSWLLCKVLRGERFDD
jgi:hypothetical protein